MLSKSDSHYLQQHLLPRAVANGSSSDPAAPPPPPIHVLLPALRSDMERLPPPLDCAAGAAWGEDEAQRRQYLACCVRLSPEKEPQRFVDLAVELQRRGVLARLGVVPLMLAAGWGSESGQQLKRRMLAGVPQSVLREEFLGPQGLREVHAQVLLNVHPCTYDA